MTCITVVFGTLNIGDYFAATVVEFQRSFMTPKNNFLKSASKKKQNKSRMAVGAPNNSQNLIYNPRPIVPDKHSAVIRFQEYIGLNSGANTYAYQSYSMNSPFDPLYTIGGGTCTGFTEWMTLYNRFYVTACRISSVIYNGGANTQFHYHMAMRSADAGAGVVPTLDRILEGRNSRYQMIWPGQHPSNGRALTVIYKPSAFEGLPNTSNREELSGDSASDPAIQPAVQVGFFGPGATTGLTSNMLVVVEYTTLFYSPRLLGDA
jgi:hypothetical protein